jgi:hypothetical protein
MQIKPSLQPLLEMVLHSTLWISIIFCLFIRLSLEENHLLNQILNGIPKVYNNIKKPDHKFFADDFGKDIPGSYFNDHYQRLSKMKSNEYGLGHLNYSVRYANMLKNLNFKHIFLYRDPRDVLVSLAYFIPEHWTDHPLYEDFKYTHLSSKVRIQLLITGVPNKFPSFKEYMGPFYMWIKDPNCLHVTFESLIASEQSRREAILNILSYLWKGLTPPVPLDRMVLLAESNINPRQSLVGWSGIGRLGS